MPDATTVKPSIAYHHPTRAIIDLAAFRHNLDVVRSCIAPGVRIMAVLKANAYGHGLRRISGEAVANGVEYVGVARAYEGVELRMAGIMSRILVFEIVPQEHINTAILQDLELTVGSLDGAKMLSAAAERLHRKARIHIEVDTGMGRLGFPSEHAAGDIEAIARLPRIELVGVYSHFATSEQADQAFARQQLMRFNDVLEGLRRRRVEVQLRHMANSGAIIALPESHFDIVRPGLLLFGYTPRKGMPVPQALQPALSLVSKVVFLKTVGPGTTISYGKRFTTTTKTAVATVPVGYGDGYVRQLTGKADVLIRGKRCPIIGAITMDQIMIDVGLENGVTEGDDVTLIGKDADETITCWELAEKAGTIPYEITCLITPRVPRVFIR